MLSRAYPVLNTDQPQHPKVRRQDFVWAFEKHKKAKAVANVYGMSFTELMSRLVDAEYNDPRLCSSMSKDDLREMFRKLFSRG